MDLTDVQTIKSLLARHNVRPKKFMGQHFLADREVLEEILAAAEISGQDTILEIGPGPGVLTLELARLAEKVIAVEKDPKLSQILQEILKKENITNVMVINQNILKISNFQFLISKPRRSRFATLRGRQIFQNTKYQIQNTRYKVVANLPYYLTAAVIRKFLEEKKPPSEMILMVQKEVAERICSQPPRMNLLAVSVQFYGQPEIAAFVSKKSFWPEPEVDSAIIKIKTKNEKRKIETEKFFKIVRLGFSSPRKKLANNLAKILADSGRKEIAGSLRKAGLRSDCRSQDLSVDNWRKLVSLLEKSIV